MAHRIAQVTHLRLVESTQPASLLVRRRLNVHFAQEGPRLTFLLAPAGFGKTTLMQQWRRQCATDQCATAWFNLDHAQDNPARIAACVRDVCQQLLDGASGGASETVEELIEALSREPRAGVVFLDDLDRLRTAAAQRALFDFIRQLPRRIRCVVASRRRPPWPLAKLRIDGEAVIVSAADLRFTPEESAELVRELRKLDLAPTQLTQLYDFAEGWPIVVALAGDGFAADTTKTLAEAIRKPQALLFEYLEEEVLATLSDDSRDLLIRTAPFAKLCASLCDSITGRADARTQIRELEREHLILTSSDNGAEWFHHRAVFSGFLRQCFERLDLQTRQSIHRQASFWFERNGQREEAVSHALAAQDHDRAARLLNALALDKIYSSRMSELLDWVRRMPTQTVRNHPSVLACAMWALFLTGRWDEIGEHLPGGLRSIESLLESDDPGEPGHAPEDRGWRGQLQLLSEIQKQRESATRFNPERLLSLRDAQAPDNHMLLGLIDITLARRYLQHGRMDEARSCFAKAQFHSDRAGNFHAAVQAACGLAHVHHVQGRLSQALAVSEEAVRCIQMHARGPAPVAAVPHLRMAEVLFERNALSEAKEHLRQCLELAQALGDPACARKAELLSVRIAYAEHGAAAALERLREIEQLAISSQHEDALRRIYAYHATLLCEAGNLTGAEALLQMLAVPMNAPAGAATQKIPHWDEDTYLTLVRFHIARGKPAVAIQWLNLLQRSAQFADRRLSLVRIDGLLALAHESRGRSMEARRALRSTLLLGEECGFMRSLIDLDPAIRPLIQSFIEHRRNQPGASNLRPNADYLSRLLELREVRGEAQPAMAPDKPASATEAPLLKPLTPRETEILRLLAEGLSNQEIAEHLAIAETTLKWHIQNMYGRLHVGSRTQAVARARRLGLIS